MKDFLFLAVIGFLTGLVDAIAGGGGLLSVPAYMIVLGPGVEAIATNKISALCSTLAALYIYRKNGFVAFKNNLHFLGLVFLGACIGAYFSQYLPPLFYKTMLFILAPFILFVLFQRHLWKDKHREPRSKTLLAFLGFICGIYDGVAGPGGGTFMFLSLFIFGGLPLHLSIGTAKLANVFSASSSLAMYLAMGKVVWWAAVPSTLTIVIGALIGARYATKNAAQYARLALALVSLLLIYRMVQLF